MRMRNGIATVGFVATLGSAGFAQGPMLVRDLASKTHIHGLAADPQTPGNLLIATHHGIYRAEPNGLAALISPMHDFMGFTAHPAGVNTLFSSGHPASGGNLGFMVSVDGGKTWSQVSPGVRGPVDFHQMTVSPADPQSIFGAFGGLQVSRDGGKTWRIDGALPVGLIDLTASALSRDRLYAGTERGLLQSDNAGKTWRPLLGGAPVTLVEVVGGELLAFVAGRGLMAAAEPEPSKLELRWPMTDGYLAHLTGDPAARGRLYAATGNGRVMVSADVGRSWRVFGSD